MPDAWPKVQNRRPDTRSVVVVIGGLEIAMTPAEAFALADRIVDAAERGKK